MPYYLVPTVNSTDITSDVASSGYYILMPYAQGIQKSDDVRDTVNIESLLTTSDSAYSKTDLNSGSLEKEDGDVDGPFDLGVSITETVDDDKETRIIYYSTSNLLQSQINPHFLYNTLDTIIWLVETGKNEQAVEMVTSLSNFFRSSLSQGRDIITLGEEEIHVRSYLEIQQVRYRDILPVSYTHLKLPTT